MTQVSAFGDEDDDVDDGDANAGDGDADDVGDEADEGSARAQKTQHIFLRLTITSHIFS